MTNTSTFGVNSGTFEIAEPFIQVNYPNGGDIEDECEAFTINWSHGGTHPNERFTLSYSDDNGATWNTIVTNYSQTNNNNSNYTWSHPPTNGPTLIRVADYYNSSLYGESATFTMTPNTDIVVLEPNGGEVWEAGTVQEIQWADNAITYCHLQYSTDNGSTWTFIDTWENSDGSFFWTIPDVPSTQCLVRIVVAIKC